MLPALRLPVPTVHVLSSPEQPAAGSEGSEAAHAAALKRTMEKDAMTDSYMECYPG